MNIPHKIKSCFLIAILGLLPKLAQAQNNGDLTYSFPETFEVCATGNEQRSKLVMNLDHEVVFHGFHTNYAVRNGERGAKGFDILIDGKSANLTMIPEPEVIVETVFVEVPSRRPPPVRRRSPRRRDPFLRGGFNFGGDSVKGSRVEIYATTGCVELRDFVIQYRDFGVCGDLRYVDSHEVFTQCISRQVSTGCFDSILSSAEIYYLENELSINSDVLPDVHQDLSEGTSETYQRLMSKRSDISAIASKDPMCREEALTLLKLIRSIGHNAGLD